MKTACGWQGVARGGGQGNHRRALGLGIALAGTLALLAAIPAGSLHGRGDMPQARVVAGGQAIEVDVATEPAQQALGLGGRKRLAAGEGMLFLYAKKHRLTFWMRGMLIPIDIIWLDNSRIVHIAHRVPPPPPGTADKDLATYASDIPANGVLELAAGRAEALGLRSGDFISITFN